MKRKLIFSPRFLFRTIRQKGDLYKKNLLEVCFGMLIIILFIKCDNIDNRDLTPGISIYKTNNDYFNLVTIGMKGDTIFHYDTYWNSRYSSMDKLLVSGNDTVYSLRARLSDGYILDAEADEAHDVFLSLTFKEYLLKEINEGSSFVNLDSLRTYILDTDPYKEYYRNKTDIKKFNISDTLEINELIRNNQIENFFEKIK